MRRLLAVSLLVASCVFALGQNSVGNPATIANCTGFWSAAQSSITYSSGLVQAVSDLSGAGNNLTQTGALVAGASGQKPHWQGGSDPAIVFDSSGVQNHAAKYSLEFPAGYQINDQAFTMAAVISPGSADFDTGRTLINANSGNAFSVQTAIDASANNASGSVTGTNHKLLTIIVRYNSVSYNTGLRLHAGKNFIAVVMGSSSCTVWHDGDTYTISVVPPASTVTSATATPIYLGAFGTTEASHAWMGRIYWLATYSSALSAQTMAQLQAYACSTGVNMYPSSQVVFDGDSLTAGYYVLFNHNWTELLNLPPDVRRWNVAVSGQSITAATGSATKYTAETTGGLNATAADNVDSLYNSHLAQNVLVVFAGTNDEGACSPAETALQTWTALQSYIQARKAIGWKVVVIDMLARNGLTYGASTDATSTVEVAPFNNLVTTQALQAGADAVVDIGSDPVLGGSSPFSYTLWGDYNGTTATHLSTVGEQLLAYKVRPALMNLLYPGSVARNGGIGG